MKRLKEFLPYLLGGLGIIILYLYLRAKSQAEEITSYKSGLGPNLGLGSVSFQAAPDIIPAVGGELMPPPEPQANPALFVPLFQPIYIPPTATPIPNPIYPQTILPPSTRPRVITSTQAGPDVSYIWLNPQQAEQAKRTGIYP